MRTAADDIRAYDAHCDNLSAAPRTLQDLLAERRALVDELRRESDKTARAMLQFAIDQIDRERNERNEKSK